MKKTKSILSFITNLFFLGIAGFINATAISLLLSPSMLLDGGISGTSIFLSHVTPLPLPLYLIGLNLPFFLFGAKKLGWKFVVNSVFGIASYAFFVFLYGERNALSQHLILMSIFGGLLSGIGSGLMIRRGGCVDGIEVMAMLFAKKLNLSVGQMVMIYNAIMMSLSIPFFGVDRALFSILAYAVGLKAVDLVVEGLDKAKASMIITSKGEDVSKAISDRFKRGITVIPGHGYYSQENKEVLYVIVNRFEVASLIALIKEIDSEAFISITEISEVVGERYEKKALYKRKYIGK